MPFFVALVLFANPAGLVSQAEEPSPGSETYAVDVLPINTNHIVIALGRGAVVRTLNGGASWSEVQTVPLGELAFGRGSTVWGFYSWAGIHEASSAAVVLSTDGGGTFTKVYLDADTVLPAAFVHSPGDEPIILTRNGHLWRHRGNGPEWENWIRIAQIPSKGWFEAGMTAGASTYAADDAKVWLRTDHGKIWHWRVLPDIVAFSRDGATCWAAQRKGKLYRARCGTQDWRLHAEVHAFETIYTIAASKDRVFVAGRTADSTALSVCVTAQGDVHQLQTEDAEPAASVRRGLDGSVWLAGQGVYRLTRGKWQLRWPTEVPPN